MRYLYAADEIFCYTCNLSVYYSRPCISSASLLSHAYGIFRRPAHPCSDILATSIICPSYVRHTNSHDISGVIGGIASCTLPVQARGTTLSTVRCIRYWWTGFCYICAEKVTAMVFTQQSLLLRNTDQSAWDTMLSVLISFNPHYHDLRYLAGHLSAH